MTKNLPNSAKARFEALLGRRGVAIAAAALKSTRPRFVWPPSDPLAAVLELLEIVAHSHGLAGLPARWRGDVPELSGAQVKARFAVLFGTPRPAAIIGRVIGKNPEPVSRALRDRLEPRAVAELAAIVEMLEVISASEDGRSAWPEKWRIALPRDDAAELRAQVTRLLGYDGASRLALGLDMSPGYVTRLLRGERDKQGAPLRIPDTVRAAVELLETLEREKIPRSRWPARWRFRRVLTARSLGKPHAGPAPVLVDEDDAGAVEGRVNGRDDLARDGAPRGLEIPNAREPEPGAPGELGLCHAEEGTRGAGLSR